MIFICFLGENSGDKGGVFKGRGVSFEDRCMLIRINGEKYECIFLLFEDSIHSFFTKGNKLS
jgi:hypothetical protein